MTMEHEPFEEVFPNYWRWGSSTAILVYRIAIPSGFNPFEENITQLWIIFLGVKIKNNIFETRTYQ